ncbi:MAG: hypothetical protein AB8G14_09455 [Ilumatobacter sp.]
MAWDSSRPVPWQRLVREWLIYVGVMAVVFALLFRNDNMVGAFAGLLISGPLYLLLGFVLAKLGYQRKSLKDMRTPQANSSKQRADSDADEGQPQKSRPAPTKRTSGGGNRPKSKPRRR